MHSLATFLLSLQKEESPIANFKVQKKISKGMDYDGEYVCRVITTKNYYNNNKIGSTKIQK